MLNKGYLDAAWSQLYLGLCSLAHSSPPRNTEGPARNQKPVPLWTGGDECAKPKEDDQSRKTGG